MAKVNGQQGKVREKEVDRSDDGGQRLSVRKRASIIDAAIETFAACGFDRANMDTIAEVANVSKRTIYNHFSSKEDLFVAIVEAIRERSAVEVRFEYLPDIPLQNQLVEFASRVIDFHCAAESRRIGRVVLSRLLERPEMARDLFDGRRFFQQDLRDWIDQAVKKKKIRKLDSEFASQQLLGLLEAFTAWPQLCLGQPEPTPTQRRRIAEQSVEMFLQRYQS